MIYFYRNFKTHERKCNFSTWKWEEALMETDGANLPPNHSLLGNATPGTKYVLCVNWMECELYVCLHKI